MAVAVRMREQQLREINEELETIEHAGIPVEELLKKFERLSEYNRLNTRAMLR